MSPVSTIQASPAPAAAAAPAMVVLRQLDPDYRHCVATPNVPFGGHCVPLPIVGDIANLDATFKALLSDKTLDQWVALAKGPLLTHLIGEELTDGCDQTFKGIEGNTTNGMGWRQFLLLEIVIGQKLPRLLELCALSGNSPAYEDHSNFYTPEEGVCLPDARYNYPDCLTQPWRTYPSTEAFYQLWLLDPTQLSFTAMENFIAEGGTASLDIKNLATAIADEPAYASHFRVPLKTDIKGQILGMIIAQWGRYIKNNKSLTLTGWITYFKIKYLGLERIVEVNRRPGRQHTDGSDSFWGAKATFTQRPDGKYILCEQGRNMLGRIETSFLPLIKKIGVAGELSGEALAAFTTLQKKCGIQLSAAALAHPKNHLVEWNRFFSAAVLASADPRALSWMTPPPPKDASIDSKVDSKRTDTSKDQKPDKPTATPFAGKIKI